MKKTTIVPSAAAAVGLRVARSSLAAARSACASLVTVKVYFPCGGGVLKFHCRPLEEKGERRQRKETHGGVARTSAYIQTSSGAGYARFLKGGDGCGGGEEAHRRRSATPPRAATTERQCFGTTSRMVLVLTLDRPEPVVSNRQCDLYPVAKCRVVEGWRQNAAA